MIRRILDRLRAGAEAPVSPATAIVAGLAAVVGCAVLMRYVEQQEAQLAESVMRLRAVYAEAKDLAQGGPYPGPEDVDPLHNGHRDVEDLADVAPAVET